MSDVYQYQPETTAADGLKNIFGLITDFARGAASAYKDVYSAFNPEKTGSTAATQTAQQTSSGSGLLAGSGIVLILLIIVAILILRR